MVRRTADAANPVLSAAPVASAADFTRTTDLPEPLPFAERPWWPAAAVAAGLWALLVHVALWWLDGHPSPRHLWGDEATYLESAARLLAGDPGWWPEPLWPPLYPQFLAGLTWLGGGSLVVVRVVQSLLLAVVAVLLADLTGRMTGSRAAAMAAAALTLGYPPLAAFAHYLWPEVLHLFLFVALLWLLVVRWAAPGWCAVAGIALGLALLAKSLLLPFAPVLLVAAAWRSRPREAVARIAVVALCAALVVAPTLAANARRLGSPVLAGSGLFNLWVGLSDVGRESFVRDVAWPEYKAWRASAPDFAGRQRVLRTKIVELLRQRGLGEVLADQLSRQYFRLFDVGCYLTDQLPGGPAHELSEVGYRDLGRGPAQVVRGVTAAAVLLLFVAAPLGLVLGGCRRHRWLRVLLLFLAYNLLLFLWFHVKTRYRIQLLPVGFVGVGCLVAWVEGGCRPRPSGWRVATALLAVAVLVALAIA
ncbi:MAG TPA: glycosyltransferase family 39 protein [Methylomirabilota bacterium]|nr:glycosyltransferase family 39 protein [Methylomirabilota bacterium]